MTADFVVDAREQTETDRFRELIRGPTPHSRYVLQALTVLSLNEQDQDGFWTTETYEIYKEVCRQEGSEALSLRRVRDLLKEHAFLDITEQSRHSGGSTEGSYTNHQLLDTVDRVIEYVSRFGWSDYCFKP